MRPTIHLVSHAGYWPLALAIRDARPAWWKRVTKADELADVAERLREALRAGPPKRGPIEALIGKRLRAAWGLCSTSCRCRRPGTWERRRADLFALAESQP